MGTIHLSLLLAGVAAVGVPVLIHLLLRQRAKRIVFPTMRFVRQREQKTSQTLRLRQWLLLLARALVLLVLAAALALAPLVTTASLAGDYVLLGVLAGLAVLLAAVLVGALAVGTGRTLAAVAGALLAVALLGGAVQAGRILTTPDGPLTGSEDDAWAVTILIDTAPRMGFEQNAVTRLATAQARAAELLPRMPAGTILDVGGTDPVGLIRAIDEAAARDLIERLSPSYLSEPITEAALAAVTQLADLDRPRRELFLLTDLAAVDWSDERIDRLARAAESAEVEIRVIDVGSDRTANIVLGPLTLSREEIVEGGRLTVTTDITGVGVGQDLTAVLLIEQPGAGPPMIRDGRLESPPEDVAARVAVTVPEDGTVPIEFPSVTLPLGTHHGRVALMIDDVAGIGATAGGVVPGVAGSGGNGLSDDRRLPGLLPWRDTLTFDNQRYFTVAVRRPFDVLLVAGPEADASLVELALAPPGFPDSEFRVTTIEQARLAATDVTTYRAVLLLDPGPLEDVLAARLTRFVEAGGGLGLFLGHNARQTDPTGSMATAEIPPSPENSGGSGWATLLPGTLRQDFRAAEPLFLVPTDYDHAMWQLFEPIQDATPWPRFPVDRLWWIDPVASDASVIARTNTNLPLVLVSRRGAGEIVTFATPLSDPPPRRGARRPWNRLPTGEEPWPFVMLINEAVGSLVRGTATNLNLDVGDPVSFPVTESDPTAFTLFTPADTVNALGQPIAALEGRLPLPVPEWPGPYRLREDRVAAGARTGRAAADGAPAEANATTEPTGEGLAPASAADASAPGDGGRLPVVQGYSANVPPAASVLVRRPLDGLRQRLAETPITLVEDASRLEEVAPSRRTGLNIYPVLMMAVAALFAMEQWLAGWFYPSGRTAARTSVGPGTLPSRSSSSSRRDAAA